MTTKFEQWRDKLAHSRQRLLELLNSLSDAQWQTIIYSEGNNWTALDIVAHLVDSESGMSAQVHKASKGQPTLPEGFDLARWNAGVRERQGNPTPAELFERLDKVRARTLKKMESLTDDQWLMTGRHAARGEVTIEQYYETIYLHELSHAKDIKSGLL